MSSTSTPISSTATTDRDLARRALLPVAAGTFLLTVFFNLARADTVAEGLAMVAVDLVVLALVFGFVVVPGLRVDAAGGRGIALGVIAVLLLIPAFWSGLPVVLGAAAVLLGHAGRRAAAGSGRATAALVLGALGVIGYVVIYVGDWVANPGASWWS